MWIELVTRLYPSASFAAAVEVPDLDRAGAQLGAALPADLRALLMESDGLTGEHGLGLVWPLSRLVEDNLEFRRNTEFRELYMPFDSLLFFGDAGNGDQFAFTVLDGQVRRPDVFAWNHEDDSRSWVAPDLWNYLEWWADGRIKV